MNELTPRGHLRPLGGRENPRRARPESRSPRRCAHARGAPYSPRAAPSILTKGEPTGTRAQALSCSCTCAKALTETHPGVRDWLSATRICMQSKLGTPSWPLFRGLPHCACCAGRPQPRNSVMQAHSAQNRATRAAVPAAGRTGASEGPSVVRNAHPHHTGPFPRPKASIPWYRSNGWPTPAGHKGRRTGR